MKPPLLYFGAKGSIAEKIVALMPAHRGYIEPYSGSLAVLLAKPISNLEVVNDIDGEIQTFWRVLRDRPDELTRAAALTPHSRAEHEGARERGPQHDEIEIARRVWIRLTQGRSATLADVKTGWRHFTQAGEGSSSSRFAAFMDAYRNRMPAAAARLLDVSLECRDALEVIQDYGPHETNPLYLDPPYLIETRRGNRYAYEAGDPDHHRAMAERVHAADAAVMISGYASELYDHELFPDWERFEFRAHTANATGGKQKRVEVIWSNRDIHTGHLDFGGIE